jgi:hypothetical protein
MAQTDSTETSPPEAPRKRSSRRRRSQSKSSSSFLARVQAFMRRKLAVRIAGGAVAAIGLMVFGVLWAAYDWGINSYLGATLADDQRSILYANGYPTAVRLDAESPWIRTNLSADGVVLGSTKPIVADRDLFAYSQWSYTLPQNAESQYSFLPGSGRVTGIACLQLQAAPGSCPPMLGITVGDLDDTIYLKVGLPQREHISGMSKHLYYDKIGVQITMSQRRVYRIDFTERTGGLGAYWAFFFRTLIL